MLNQEYIDGGIYWGIGGYPGYIPGCHNWGDTKPNGYGPGCTLGGGIGTGSVWETLYNATWAAGASFVESWNDSCSHVHGDYRSW